MAFKVAARTLLELGSELISSDAVALYELIKNSVDAGTKSVLIDIQICLKRSYYLEAIDALTRTHDIDKIRLLVKSQVEPTQHEQVRRNFLTQVFKPTEDLHEFEANLQRAYHDYNWIKVCDEGHGMDENELREVFLTIGTRNRRAQKFDKNKNMLESLPHPLGEKGVGRLSAMRLGDHMVVSSCRKQCSHFHILDIDWLRFSHDTNHMINEIEISPKRGGRKKPRMYQGTSILIRNLSSDWDIAIFQSIVDEQFKRFVNPFPISNENPKRYDPNELFDLQFNGTSVPVPRIPQWLLNEAHAKVVARYRVPEHGEPSLFGEVFYRLRNKELQFEVSESNLLSLVDPMDDRQIRTNPGLLRKLGSFSVEFYWFNRRLLTEIQGIGKKSDIVKIVNSWAGGVMVFRDSFRINPYGGQDDDWLKLDKTAFSAKSYKVNRSQIIGHVNLSWHNHRLIEQTNREGFVNNEYKQILVGILRYILITEFRTFITKVDMDRKLTDKTTTDSLDQRLIESRTKFDTILETLEPLVPEESNVVQELRSFVNELDSVVEDARVMAREYEDDRSKFVHLAGIGLIVEFILHEIGRSTTRALSAFDELEVERFNASTSAAFTTLKSQLSTLRKRVETLDPLSTSRRQIKQMFDVKELVQQVIDGRTQQFARHGVSVCIKLPKKPYKLKAVKGMLIQIIENLIENSIYWLKVETRRRKFNPEIEVTLSKTEKRIVFTDNGPGVSNDLAQRIFEPFYSTKPPGKGRGLGLYISQEIARYHGWDLYLSIDDVESKSKSSTFVLEF